jgi:hypothetical protein
MLQSVDQFFCCILRIKLSAVLLSAVELLTVVDGFRACCKAVAGVDADEESFFTSKGTTIMPRHATQSKTTDRMTRDLRRRCWSVDG